MIRWLHIRFSAVIHMYRISTMWKLGGPTLLLTSPVILDRLWIPLGPWFFPYKRWEIWAFRTLYTAHAWPCLNQPIPMSPCSWPAPWTDFSTGPSMPGFLFEAVLTTWIYPHAASLSGTFSCLSVMIYASLWDCVVSGHSYDHLIWECSRHVPTGPSPCWSHLSPATQPQVSFLLQRLWPTKPDGQS